jgi:hypothetical protein
LILSAKSIEVNKLVSVRLFISVAIGLFVVLIIALAFDENFGQLLPASIIAYASCFLLTIYFLRNRMHSLFDLVLTAATSTFSGVWLYEMAYHYFWGTSLASLFYDFSHFPIALSYPGSPFPIWFAIPVLLFPFLKRQYISLSKPLVIVLAVSIGLFALWFDLGLPQFFYPQYYDGTLFSSAQVREVGYVMNSLTKLLAVVPAFLFCNKGQLTLQSDNQLVILQNLKNSFLLLLIGAIIESLPIVGSVGLVVMAVGLFVLILSIRASGDFGSDLSIQIRSNIKRFIETSITAIVILVSGLIAITAPLGSLIESIVSTQNNIAILDNIAQVIPNFRNISYEILALAAIVYLVWILGWLKICSSIRILAEEFAQPKLAQMAVYYSVYVIIGFFTVVSVILFVISGGSGLFLGTSQTTVHLYNILLYGSFYGFLVGGPWLIFSVVLLGQATLIAIGSYLGYTYVKNAIENSRVKIAVKSLNSSV